MTLNPLKEPCTFWPGISKQCGADAAYGMGKKLRYCERHAVEIMRAVPLKPTDRMIGREEMGWRELD